MGIQAAGGVIVPVYPSSTAEQAAYVIRHCDAKVVFVDGAPLLARRLNDYFVARSRKPLFPGRISTFV